MQFELDVIDATISRSLITAAGGKVVESVDPGPAGGNPCLTIEAPDEATAFAVVNAVYGPEDDSRESNAFYVYSE